MCKAAELYANHGKKLETELGYLSYELQEKYDYIDDDYIIAAPDSVAQMIIEAFHMKNCLFSYIIPFLSRATDIVLMRKRLSPERSYITMEIKEKKLIQARKACNRPVDEQDLKSIRRFCDRRGITIEAL